MKKSTQGLTAKFRDAAGEAVGVSGYSIDRATEVLESGVRGEMKHCCSNVAATLKQRHAHRCYRRWICCEAPAFLIAPRVLLWYKDVSGRELSKIGAPLE